MEIDNKVETHKNVFGPSLWQLHILSLNLNRQVKESLITLLPENRLKFARENQAEVDYLRNQLRFYEESELKWQIKTNLAEVIDIINRIFRDVFPK